MCRDRWGRFRPPLRPRSSGVPLPHPLLGSSTADSGSVAEHVAQPQPPRGFGSSPPYSPHNRPATRSNDDNRTRLTRLRVPSSRESGDLSDDSTREETSPSHLSGEQSLLCPRLLRSSGHQGQHTTVPRHAPPQPIHSLATFVHPSHSVVAPRRRDSARHLITVSVRANERSEGPGSEHDSLDRTQ